MNQNDIGRQHNQTYNFRMLVLLLLCARVFVCVRESKRDKRRECEKEIVHI